MNKNWVKFILIILLVVFALLVDIPKLPTWVPFSSWFSKYKIHLGLDLQGGTQLTYQTDTKDIPVGERSASIEGARDVIERRVNVFGVAEPVIQTAKVGDEWKIVVELPGIKNVDEAINMIGETPTLEFKEQAPAKELTAADIKAINDYNQKAKIKAEEILKKVLQPNSDFVSLAKEYSEDPGSKDNGGSLGWFGHGAMVKEFEDVAFALKKGEIAKNLTKTQYGYHIIKKVDERENANGEQEILVSHILIRTTSEEEVKGGAEQWAYTGLTGKHLKTTKLEFDPNTNEPIVSIEFDEEGTRLFASLTKKNINKPLAIFLDGLPISTPIVQEEIPSGKAVITGKFTVQEAKDLVMRLRSGALPVPIKLVAQQNVGPSLGKLFLQKSIMAGLIGFFLVSLFMIIFYGGFGWVAVIALTVYSLLNIMLFKLIPVTLTLAGIAGFIISVGMAVDANVLVFERIKDEKRIGKKGMTAIEEGFRQSWSAIRDSNITTLIACFFLYEFGTGLIRGFGLVLGIGVLVSMFTALTVSRTIIRLTTNKNK